MGNGADCFVARQQATPPRSGFVQHVGQRGRCAMTPRSARNFEPWAFLGSGDNRHTAA